jgi:hypothetical protein
MGRAGKKNGELLAAMAAAGLVPLAEAAGMWEH